MSDLPIIELDNVDSTNNYAIQLIDANKAYHGLTIIAANQTAGKGQRGRSWVGAPGSSLLMSVVLTPKQAIHEQFCFNASVATAIANCLEDFCTISPTFVKWPNDIIVNDKKAGGILIENVLRGSKWAQSVVGIGLNINQEEFPEELPFATSVRIATGKIFDVRSLAMRIRDAILEAADTTASPAFIMKQYNELLYKRGQRQLFSSNGEKWMATILEALPNGTLRLQLADHSIAAYQHGEVMWEW